jgi:hypothetical protein
VTWPPGLAASGTGPVPAGRVRTRIEVKMTTGMPRACPQALIWVQAVVRLSCW